MKLSGLTVEEVIKKLQRCNPQAVVVVPAGEGTVYSPQVVRAGAAYDFLGREPECGAGMSRFNFILATDLMNFPHWPEMADAVEVVCIE